MSSSVVAALEGVDKLRKELEGLRKEVRELEVQLTIARGAAKSAVQERDFQTVRAAPTPRRLATNLTALATTMHKQSARTRPRAG